MIIPIKTDAPLYYWPYATFGIIAVNVLLFFFTGEPTADSGWLLQFGVIAPYQWLTSAFSHIGLGHLIGNMYFLFVFGPVVEGRMGWKKFVPLYLVLAVAQGLIVQVMMLGVDPAAGEGALGASGVIYSLLVVAVFWSPHENVHMLFWVVFFVRMFTVRVIVLAGFYISLNLLAALVTGFDMSTAVLHLIGALMGLVPAIMLPRSGKIYLGDWEGLLSLPFRVKMVGTPEGEPERSRPEPEPEPVALSHEEREASSRADVYRAIAGFEYLNACAAQRAYEAEFGPLELTWEQERLLLEGLLSEQEVEAVCARIEYLSDRGQICPPGILISAAAGLVHHAAKPRGALRLIAAIDQDVLDDRDRARLEDVIAVARRQIDEGVLEI